MAIELDSESSPHLSRQCQLGGIAIKLRSAMAPDLAYALDSAAALGALPPRAWFAPRIDSERAESSGHWDGCIDGEPLDFAREMLWCTLRDWYGWGIPCGETIDAIERVTIGHEHGLIDFGAGSGYWSSVMRARGNRVIAVDIARENWRWQKSWTEIMQRDGFGVIAARPGCPILMSWPEHGLSGDRLVKCTIAGQILFRCGPRDVTGGNSFNSALVKWFDLIGTAPVLSACGSSDGVMEILMRRNEVSGVEYVPPVSLHQ
jgi:hypothetical protein